MAALGLHCGAGFSVVAANKGCCLNCSARTSHCSGFYCCRAQTLKYRFSGCAHRLSCSEAWAIFPDQGSNPRPPNWQADSLPLSQQGSPGVHKPQVNDPAALKTRCSLINNNLKKTLQWLRSTSSKKIIILFTAFFPNSLVSLNKQGGICTSCHWVCLPLCLCRRLWVDLSQPLGLWVVSFYDYLQFHKLSWGMWDLSQSSLFMFWFIYIYIVHHYMFVLHFE